MIATRPLPSALDLLDLHRSAPARYPLLLESAAAGTAQGRWDLLLATSGESLSAREGEGFLAALDREWRSSRIAREEPRWPFRGGWALYLGYELAGEVEPVLSLPRALGGLPVAMALRCPAAILRDRASGECVAVAETAHAGMLDAIEADIATLAALPPLPEWTPPRCVAEDEPARFTDGVRRVLDYLAAGDVFQANISRGWNARFARAPQPAELFQRLRRHNPAPFAGVFAGEGFAVVSASPERLVSVRGDVVETRPIAGTRPRGADREEDTRLERELLADEKERAEHVMLADLGRNDIGRIASIGTVRVPAFMQVEHFSHVMHIVSEVEGELKEGLGAVDALRACFPAGTVSGAPKVRAMQIISELERDRRGPYAGAAGYIGYDGNMDTAIAIRTMVVRDGVASVQAGAGLVADSVPATEYMETQHKARALLSAIDLAEEMEADA
jgi:anthranilate synthase component 1